jgi:hypothetical protein
MSEFKSTPTVIRIFTHDTQLPANLDEHFQGEKSDLAPIIFFVIKKTIAFDATVGHAINLPMFNERMFTGGLAVVAKKIMTARGVKMRDAEVGRFERDQLCPWLLFFHGRFI